ncbi:hypothetical protein EC991_009543 [Linnemannia zychae]|nr:hypothetical protein EC991_009543 [Linnemannia zychae]
MTVPATPFTSDLTVESIRSLYDQLAARLKDISHLQGIARLLGWDQLVMMPEKAEDARSDQASLIAGISHDMETSPILGALLEKLHCRQTTEDLSSELNPYELANIRLAYKSFKEEALVPTDLVKASSAAITKSVSAWEEARETSDFSKFAPFLEEQIRLIRQTVTYKMKGGVCEEAIRINKRARASLGLLEDDECFKGYYQVLIDEYEPGFKDSRIEALFSDLKQHLIPLIARIKAKSFQHENGFLKNDFDVDKQAELSHLMCKKMGFDTDAGRLDVSTHPFTGGAHPTDIRMTTRYAVNNFQEGITGTMHETGHALYQQGRHKEYHDFPASDSLSVGIDESQALLWERMVALGKPFLGYTLPLMKEHFADHEDLQAVTVDQLYNAFNRVEPGFNRIESDEVTYSMHVILRYEIEKALVEGDIQVADVPALWNAKMKEYLGLEVTEDRVGCLQDTHWAIGLIGYFPTYTLGSMYAIHIFNAAKEAIPDLDDHLAKGDLLVLKEWLNKNIHQQGSLKESGDDLILALTGKLLDISLFVKYLNDKYTDIYDL